jgi:3-oxoacyl-[acyl-carrier protein] reductase
MKTILVTGGSGGIGAEICRKFAADGFRVISTYRSDEVKAQKLINELGEGHSVIKASNTNPEEIREVVEFVVEKYGRLDILVNNAGITTPVAHEDLDGLTDDWIDQIMQTNFRGSFAMIRAFKDLLLETATKTGKPSLVVNISSIAGQFGIGSNVAYCASKAAMDSMTRSLGRSLAPNIRVVSVAPGWVLGEYSQQINPEYISKQKNSTPMSRLATAEDVANTVVALDRYLTFTTGAVIPVDGGRVLGQ